MPGGARIQNLDPLPRPHIQKRAIYASVESCVCLIVLGLQSYYHGQDQIHVQPDALDGVMDYRKRGCLWGRRLGTRSHYVRWYILEEILEEQPHLYHYTSLALF